MQNTSENNKVEIGLIAGVVVPQLLTFVLKGSLNSFWLFTTSCVFLLILIGYYSYTGRSSAAIFFLLLMAGALVADLYLEKQNPLGAVRLSVRSILGIWLLVSAIKESMKTKSFEMLTFIAAFFLLLQSVLYFSFAAQEKNIEMIVLFGGIFSLATLIYFENLWDQYNSVAKKWIIVTMLTLLIDVLFLSKDLF